MEGPAQNVEEEQELPSQVPTAVPALLRRERRQNADDGGVERLPWTESYVGGPVWRLPCQLAWL